MPIFSSHGVPWSALETTHVVRLSVCPSVCPSVCHRNPSASKNHAYQPNLMPINHHANQPPCPPPQSLRIITIGQNATQPPCPPSQSLRTITIGQNAYQPFCPYSLPTYALLSRLLSHFGLFLFYLAWHLSLCFQNCFLNLMYESFHFSSECENFHIK